MLSAKRYAVTSYDRLWNYEYLVIPLEDFESPPEAKEFAEKWSKENRKESAVWCIDPGLSNPSVQVYRVGEDGRVWTL